MKKNRLGPLRPMIFLFAALNAFFVVGRSMLIKWGFDPDVLIVGHLIVFITIVLSYVLMLRSMNSPNPQSFVRAVYGSFMIKLFVLVVSAFVYIMLSKKNVNKPSLFTCVGLYFVYTFIEISLLTKLLKEKKNA